VVGYGFTERQAGFVVTVMLHSGVCLGRHYCTFSRITWGQKMHDFFRKLLDRGYATARKCGHNTARLYHIHHKPLYEAIGEPDNRHRKPIALPRAVERLMLLDAILAERRVQWLATEQDKVAHFMLTRQVPRRDLPTLVFRADNCGSETVRYFPDKLPIGLGPDRRTHIFMYLVTRPLPVDFRMFLERHAELLRALPEWTVRLLVPRHLKNAVPRYQDAFREQVARPLNPTVRDELRWYFTARRDGSPAGNGRYDRARQAFGAPRFRVLYRAWLERGDSVVAATVSPVLADAIGRRTGHLECHVLPHRYLHLSTLAGTA
jgi:hypothetical protein